MLSDFILSFETPNHHYCYDAHTNGILRLDEATWKTLQEIKSNPNAPGNDAFLINLLKKCGLTFPQKTPVIEQNTQKDHLSEALNSDISQLTLFISEDCNLNCAYCIFGESYPNSHITTHHQMSFNVAKQAIDFYLTHSENKRHKSLGFYGGEPLTNFSVLKQSIQYFLSQLQTDNKANLSITTNGTLLNDANIPFFVDHNVNLLISLDGPQQYHDHYRKTGSGAGSFTTIIEKLEAIHAHFPDYYLQHVAFNSVITPRAKLFEVYDFFKQNAFLAQNSHVVSYVRPFGTDQFWHSLDEDTLHEIDAESEAFRQFFLAKAIDNDIQADWFLRDFFTPGIETIHNRIREPGFVDPIHPNGICFPGLRKMVVHPNGDIYFCERVITNQPIGNLTTGFDVDYIKKLLDDYIHHCQQNCTRCWAVRLCKLCFVHQFNGNADPGLKDSLCESNRNLIKKDLINYCTVREENNTAFDFLNR